MVSSLREVDRILAKHGAKIDALPEPTRRAHRFLAGLDFDAITSQVTAGPEVAARGDVSLVGLKSYLDGISARLAEPGTAEEANDLHRSIQSASTTSKLICRPIASAQQT